MATARIVITCPECRMPIHLQHAVTIAKHGSELVLELNRDAIRMHDCLRTAG